MAQRFAVIGLGIFGTSIARNLASRGAEVLAVDWDLDKVEALKDENWNVQKNAAEALGKIGDKRAINPLMEALKGEDGYVRKTAGKVLEEIKSL